MRPSRGLSRALPAVSRRTRWEAGSRQPSRESPYGLEATATRVDLVWCRHCVIREVDSDRAAAYDANAVDVQIIKSERTGVRRIKLRSKYTITFQCLTLSICLYSI